MPLTSYSTPLISLDAVVLDTETTDIDARSVALVAQGKASLAAGDENSAIDAFETALAVDPKNRAAFIALGQVSQKQGLPGKAIRYYREQARPHLVPFPGRRSPAAQDMLPEGLEPVPGPQSQSLGVTVTDLWRLATGTD